MFHSTLYFILINNVLYVLAVSNVLTALIFSNSRNSETEGDTPEKNEIKSIDPEEIYQFGLSFLVVSPSVSKVREFEKIKAVNTFETASTVVYQIMSGNIFFFVIERAL